jgi:hypothetical protein
VHGESKFFKSQYILGDSVGSIVGLIVGSTLGLNVGSTVGFKADKEQKQM